MNKSCLISVALAIMGIAVPAAAQSELCTESKTRYKYTDTERTSPKDQARYFYDSNGKRILEGVWADNTWDGDVYSYEYDSSGRTAIRYEYSVSRGVIGDVSKHTEYVYDADGKLLEELTYKAGETDVNTKNVYTYNEDGTLAKKELYGQVYASGTYSLGLMNIEEYVYDNGVRVRMDKKKASGSDNGREEYTYNADGMLASTTAYLPGDVLNKRTDYTYENGLLKEATPYKWNMQSSEWGQTNYIEVYKYKAYGAEYAPTLSIMKDADTHTTLHFAVLSAEQAEGVTGYWLVSDGHIDVSTTYGTTFDLTEVSEGVHEYRVIPVDGSDCGLTASDIVTINVAPSLPGAKNETKTRYKYTDPGRETPKDQTRYYYDAEGYLILEGVWANDAWDTVYSYVNDASGNPQTRYEYSISAGSIGDVKTRTDYVYDAENRLTDELTYKAGEETVNKKNVYAYNEDGTLAKKEIYGQVFSAGDYTLGITGIEEYVYENGVRVRMNKKKASGSDNGREEYTYDPFGRLIQTTVYLPGEMLSKRIDYTYEDGMLKESIPYSFNSRDNSWKATNYIEVYGIKSYDAAYAPTLSVAKDAAIYTTLHFTVTPGSKSEGVTGYWLISDGHIDTENVYGETFEITEVTEGEHEYRVIPVDGSVCGLNASAAVSYTLTAPLVAGKAETKTRYKYTDTERQNPKDQTRYYYDGDGRLIIEGVWADDMWDSDVYSYEYETGDKPVKRYEYSVSRGAIGDVSKHTDYVYDADGKLLEELTYKTGEEDVNTKNVYTYNEDGTLAKKELYGQVYASGTYSLGLMNIEEYVYENGVRVRMNKKKASGSDNGHEEYTYNAEGMLSSTTTYLPGDVLNKRTDYTYEDGLLKEAVPYKWDGGSETWTETNYIEVYGLKSYDAAFAPALGVTMDADNYTTLHFTVLPGVKNDGVTGYWLVSDGRIDLSNVYGENFDLTEVADGVHEYRVIPVDGSTCGLTASNATSILVKYVPKPVDDSIRVETVQLFKSAYPDVDYAQERYFYDREGHVIISSKFSSAEWDDPYYSYEYFAGKLIRRNEHSILTNVGKPAKYVLYSYNADGTLASEEEYSVSTAPDKDDAITASYTYTYTDGLLSERLRKRTVDNVLQDFKIERYTYDAEGVLTKMERYDAQSPEAAPEAVETYEYNSKGLLTVKTIDSTIAGTITRWTYTYDENDKLIRELPEQQVDGVWTFRGGEKREYSYKKYVVDTAPTLSVEVDENTFNTLKFTVTPGTEAIDDLQGYWLVTDGVVDNFIARKSTFTLTGVADGEHTFRVIPADSSECGLVASDPVKVTIERQETLDLAAPTDLRMVMLERTISVWKVGIEWTAPQSTNAHLAGYRYVFGDTYNNGEFEVDATRGVAKCIENGLHVPLKLYAIYAEGESEPAILDVDMTNWNAQITLHWEETVSTDYDMNDNALKSSHFYYDREGNLAATVEYDSEGKPVRRIRDISKNLILKEVYDEEGKCWKNGERVDITTSSSSGSPMEYSYSKWNEATGEFELTSREVLGRDPSHEHVPSAMGQLPYSITEYDGAGNVVKYTVYHYDGTKVFLPYTRSGMVYASDAEGAAIIGKSESTWTRSGVMEECVEYSYENGEYKPAKRFTEDWIYDDFNSRYYQAAAAEEEWDGQDWKKVSHTDIVASPEYHTAHTPLELYYEHKTLDWLSPERIHGDFKGYTLLLNHVPFADFTPDVRVFELKDIPDGTHTFNVLAIYDDGEANISDPVEVKCTGFSGIDDAVTDGDNLIINGSEISVPGAIAISVYDVNGMTIKSAHTSSISLDELHNTVVIIVADCGTAGMKNYKLFVR